MSPSAERSLRDRQGAYVATDQQCRGRRPSRAVPTSNARVSADAPAVRQFHSVGLAAALRKEVHELQLGASMPEIGIVGGPFGSKFSSDRHVSLAIHRMVVHVAGLELDAQPTVPSGVPAVTIRNALQRSTFRVERRTLHAFH